MPLNNTEREELSVVYQTLNCVGVNHAKRLSMCLSQMPGGNRITDAEFGRIIRLVDKNGDTRMNVEEFLIVVEGMGVGSDARPTSYVELDLVAEEFKKLKVNVKMPLSNDIRAELQEIFRSLDCDGSGAISAKELADSLSKMWGGAGINEADCAQIISIVDTNGDKQLDVEEFLRIVEEGMSITSGAAAGEENEDFVADLFTNFDVNGDGTIDKTELREVLTALGEDPTEHEFEQMFREADIDNDGTITLEEFRALAGK